MHKWIVFLFGIVLMSRAEAVMAKALMTPNEVVASSSPQDWKEISPADLLVLELVPRGSEKPRRVVMQLMPPPFSQGWVRNIRRLASTDWWSGLAIVRVHDNYVVQWGDPNSEEPNRAKKLPAGIETMSEADYIVRKALLQAPGFTDAYASKTGFIEGWPVAGDAKNTWPVHCYGALGVGRNLSPDTGTGAELYTVIGHAPRHLDRNIAVVGRVIDGIEHLTSLPRGTGTLGFYENEKERVGISSIRLMNQVPVKERTRYEFLDTASEVFRRYTKVRANRHDAFYFAPAGGVDVCNVTVPIRKK